MRPLLACLFSAFCLSSLLNTDFLRADDRAVLIRDFQAYLLDSRSYTDDQKQRATKRLDALAADDANYAELIADVLVELNADFAAGFASFRAGNFGDAIPKLKPLSLSDDPYVAGESKFYLATAYVLEEDHESALPLLSVANFKRTPHTADALFLLGICQKNLLQRTEALQTFTDFLRNYPRASERQRNAAFMQIEQLMQIEAGTLADIYQKMEFSRRRLARAKANEPTQTQQKEAVAILDQLIKVAEEKEAVSESESKKEKEGNKSESKSKGKGGGKEGDGEGTDDKSDAKTVRQVQQGVERSPWDFMRDKKRDAEALGAIKEKYPARYRALIEQYYRSLQDETER